MQINGRRSRVQNPRMQTNVKKCAKRTCLHLFAFLGFAICSCGHLFSCVGCSFAYVFALLVVSQFVRPAGGCIKVNLKIKIKNTPRIRPKTPASEGKEVPKL